MATTPSQQTTNLDLSCQLTPGGNIQQRQRKYGLSIQGGHDILRAMKMLFIGKVLSFTNAAVGTLTQAGSNKVRL